MKLVSYLAREEPTDDSRDVPSSYGAIANDTIVDLATGELPTLRTALAREGVDGLRRRFESTGRSRCIPLQEAILLPPVVDPDKILCVGLNFYQHAREANMEVPSQPSVFVRFISSLVGHGQPVLRPPESERFDYEAELAVIIGARARRVSEADAMRYVAGYACLAENSIRDWQRHSNQATPGKNFAQSGAFGPYLVTADEVVDPANMMVVGRLNGEEVQRDSVGNMIFSVARMVAYLSTFTELLPGDVISMGTPAGVGMSRKPPRFLKEGDVFEVDITGLGVLRNPVHDESQQES